MSSRSESFAPRTGLHMVQMTDKQKHFADELSNYLQRICNAKFEIVIGNGKEGIVLGGSFSGLKDINESVIQASAAALAASHVIHTAGGSLAPEITPDEPLLDISQEPPRVMIAVCTCGDLLSKFIDTQDLVRRLEVDPAAVERPRPTHPAGDPRRTLGV